MREVLRFPLEAAGAVAPWLVALVAGIGTACTVPNPAAEDGEGSGTDGDTGADDGGGDCEPGTLDCGCLEEESCAAGLTCELGVCVEQGVCGDGNLDDGEECDDGEANADDAACTSECKEQECGDGHVGPEEACDDGNEVDEDACLSSCELNVCGDGILDPQSEQCDDGNAIQTDDCFDDCTLRSSPGCGDGRVEPGEFCHELGSPEALAYELAPSVAIADVDGDSHLDVIVMSYYDGGDVPTAVLQVFPGDGEGLLSTPQTHFLGGDPPRAMAVGDLDGDDKLDVVWTNAESDTASVVFGQDQGFSFPPQEFAAQELGEGVAEVHVGRVNSDGFDDFVFGHDGLTPAGEHQLVAVTGGDAPIVNNFEFESGPFPQFGLVDLDGDGLDEAVITDPADAAIRVHAGLGAGGQLASHDLVDVRGYDVLGVDMNGDGAEEAVLTDWRPADCPPGAPSGSCEEGRIVVVPGVPGDPTSIGPVSTQVVGSAPYATVAADFDMDGQLDLAVGHAVDTRHFFLFAAGLDDLDKIRTRLAGYEAGPVGMATGDLNEDGVPDLVVVHTSEGVIAPWLSNP